MTRAALRDSPCSKFTLFKRGSLQPHKSARSLLCFSFRCFSYPWALATWDIPSVPHHALVMTLTSTFSRSVIDLTQDEPPTTRPQPQTTRFPQRPPAYGSHAFVLQQQGLLGVAAPPRRSAWEGQQHPAKRRRVEPVASAPQLPGVTLKTFKECLRDHLLPAIREELTKYPRARYLRQQIAEAVSCCILAYCMAAIQRRPMLSSRLQASCFGLI